MADNQWIKETPKRKILSYLTIMIAVLGTAAQIERENLQYRLQSGKKVYVEKTLLKQANQV
jgi:hypothetical protein